MASMENGTMKTTIQKCSRHCAIVAPLLQALILDKLLSVADCIVIVKRMHYKIVSNGMQIIVKIIQS